MWYIVGMEKEDKMRKKEVEVMVSIWYMVRNWLVGDGEEVRIEEDKELWNWLDKDEVEVMKVLENKDECSLMVRYWVRCMVRKVGYKEVEKGLEVFMKEVEWVKDEWSKKELEEGLSDLVWR